MSAPASPAPRPSTGWTAPTSSASVASRDSSSAPASVPGDPDQILMFDALGPFFTGHEVAPGTAINWSKIPFAGLERAGALDPARRETVLTALDQYLAAMAAQGYNTVAIDDLAHLASHPWYPDALRRRLEGYRELYARAFALAAGHGLKVFVLTDYCFGNEAIRRHLTETGRSDAEFFADTLRLALSAWPQIAGIVLRIGESDGVDVEDAFTSRIAIRRPREARALLERLLPVCEAHGVTLVARTWTLGAYPVGDLIWNPRTYATVFDGLDSPNLVVSLKYGDADFFRFLKLNPLFFHGPQRKLIELQCRREYEGMGEFPSFVGWLYAGYLADLRSRANNVVGVFALQGGGWAPFDRLAFCGDGAFWNELNACVTVGLVARRDEGVTVEALVAAFCAERGIADVEAFLRLLRLSDEAIERGLYIREFAERPLYFRRVRVPSLIWVFWNNVTTGGLVARLHRLRVRDKTGAIADGQRAVEVVREMLTLARTLGFPESGFRFQLMTFELLALLREVLLGVDTAETRGRLTRLAQDYRRAYPHGFAFDGAPTRRDRLDPVFALALPLFLRNRGAYRRADRLLLNPGVNRLKGVLSTRLTAWLTSRLGASLPAFVDRQGMSTDVLLK